MITRLKILSTPYYVNHDKGFDSKQVCVTTDGRTMLPCPPRGDLFIAFIAQRNDQPGHSEIVIMDYQGVWLFSKKFPPVKHFTIMEKVTSNDIEQYILALTRKGNQIEIEYEKDVE